MKEKTTRFRIADAKLTKDQLMNHMGCEPERTKYIRVSFEGKSLGNRCSPTIVDHVVSTIKPEERHKWKFEASNDFNYREALKKVGKQFDAKIEVDHHKIPKWVQVSSKEKRHLGHEKTCQLLGQRLRRKGILLLEPIFCAEMDDKIVCPTRKEWLSAIGAQKE